MCTKQDQKREQGIQLPVSHAFIDHHICHGVRPLRCHAKNGSFSSSIMNCMSMDSITEVFYHLNKMLIATKHTGIIIWSFSKTAHCRHILYATQSKPLNFTFSDLWLQDPSCDWWTPLIIRFRESYNSMSMSRNSTSLKKSSGDCLKLAKQRYSILSEMMLFRNYCIFSGNAEALVRCGGKL